MPFTFAHPAAVLPLKYFPSKWFSMTGLVIGSLAPDFEYFLRMRIHSSYSHTWVGVLWLDMPLAICVCFLYHLMVRDSLIDNLPLSVRCRVTKFKCFAWTNYFKRNILVVIMSVFLGCASHLVWDGWTHPDGVFVQGFAYLQHEISFRGVTFPLYKILQHLSTILGFALLSYSLFTLPVSNDDKGTDGSNYWLFVMAVAFVVILARLVFGQHNVLGNIVATAITGVMVGTIVTPMWLAVANGR